MVLGLLRFTNEEESLFLLDEPDTHLNPAWAIQYLDLLQRVVGTQNSSHVIMATHNPLVVANLERSQVLVMNREEGTDKIRVNTPQEDPRGMGVAALLTSDVYGLRSQLDLLTLRLLDRKRELAIQDELTPSDRRELEQLNQKLGEMDFADTVRDPLYKPFVEAMTAFEKEEGIQTVLLTEEELTRRREMAENIVRRFKVELQQGH